MDEQMLKTYRHDAHKMHGASHSNNPDEVAGVSVNEQPAYGADGDAARMSRPRDRRQTVDDHETHYRRSLITGEITYDPEVNALRHFREEMETLLTTDTADGMHRAWLGESRIPALFNEDVFQPYTSLRYHTLLVAALVDNYRSGNDFSDLVLAVTEDVIPHRTVYDGRFTLSILPEHDGRAISTAKIGYCGRNWSEVWSRMRPVHPLDTDENRFEMLLDAQLRRIQSWSTALQFIEDFENWRGDYE